jgi:hypothetical protein
MRRFTHIYQQKFVSVHLSPKYMRLSIFNISDVEEVRDLLKQIGELNDKIKIIEEEIGVQTETIKDLYLKLSLSMKQSQNYLLTGVQTFLISKSYLVTFRGIEVLGEETISIPVFIDNHFNRRVIMPWDIPESE